MADLRGFLSFALIGLCATAFHLAALHRAPQVEILFFRTCSRAAARLPGDRLSIVPEFLIPSEERAAVLLQKRDYTAIVCSALQDVDSDFPDVNSPRLQ
jgi:hypothetical protein